MNILAKQVIEALREKSNPEKIEVYKRFFKTKKGEYGEDDLFIGVVVPECRKIAIKFKDREFKIISELLYSRYHEVRLVALLILVIQFEEAYKKKDKDKMKAIFDFYLYHTRNINNWDLVDLSCSKIVGAYLLSNLKEVDILFTLAKSESIWERRIAMVSTFTFIKAKKDRYTYRLVDQLMADKHDLIHKACGWMLREAGKNVSKATLREYLDKNKSKMPRTMLRYAIEKFEEKDRKALLSL